MYGVRVKMQGAGAAGSRGVYTVALNLIPSRMGILTFHRKLTFEASGSDGIGGAAAANSGHTKASIKNNAGTRSTGERRARLVAASAFNVFIKPIDQPLKRINLILALCEDIPFLPVVVCLDNLTCAVEPIGDLLRFFFWYANIVLALQNKQRSTNLREIRQWTRRSCAVSPLSATVT
jgi:hypothetical protein